MKRVIVSAVLTLMLIANAPVLAADVSEVHIFYGGEYENGVTTGEYFCQARVHGSGVDFAGISDGDHPDYEPEGKHYLLEDWGEDVWGYESPAYSSFAALTADYPVGDWIFRWESGIVEDEITVSLSGIAPGGLATITSPGYGQMGVSTDPTITWSFNSADGDAIGLNLYNYATDEEVAWEVWQGQNYPPVSNSWAPGTLEENTEYEINISLWEGQVNTGVSSANSDLVDTFAYYGYINSSNFQTIPEPATIALLGFGGLLLRRRKKA